MDKAQEIVAFWVEDVGPTGWYSGSAELDQTIRERFQKDWDLAKAGQFDSWACCPEKSLALLILLDQFPRNMFRNDAKAFSTDKKAREVANKAIEKRFDMRTPEPQRQFYYLPLMHSECLQHQERCVRLVKQRLEASGEQTLLHSKAHREVIRKFGRFPYRNQVLDRVNTPSEQLFIELGGYQTITDSFQNVA